MPNERVSFGMGRHSSWAYQKKRRCRSAAFVLVLTYRPARLMKKLAERGDPRFRIVDEKSAYYRPEPEDEEPVALYTVLKALLQAQ